MQVLKQGVQPAHLLAGRTLETLRDAQCHSMQQPDLMNTQNTSCIRMMAGKLCTWNEVCCVNRVLLFNHQHGRMHACDHHCHGHCHCH